MQKVTRGPPSELQRFPSPTWVICIVLLNGGGKQANWDLQVGRVGMLLNIPQIWIDSRRANSVVIYRFRTWQIKENVKLLVYDRTFLSCANISNFNSISPPFHSQRWICWLTQGHMVNYVRTWILSLVCPTPMLEVFYEIIFITEERGGSSFWRVLLELKWSFPVKAAGIPSMKPACAGQCTAGAVSYTEGVTKCTRAGMIRTTYSFVPVTKPQKLTSKCLYGAQTTIQPQMYHWGFVTLPCHQSLLVQAPSWLGSRIIWVVIGWTNTYQSQGRKGSEVQISTFGEVTQDPPSSETWSKLSHSIILSWEIYPAPGIKIIPTSSRFTPSLHCHQKWLLLKLPTKILLGISVL